MPDGDTIDQDQDGDDGRGGHPDQLHARGRRSLSYNLGCKS